MDLTSVLAGIPPLLVYAIIFLVVGIESLGVPLPGETAIIAAALLASTDHSIHPLWVGVAAVSGAIIGDSCGYFIGRRLGPKLLSWMSRKFPKHLSEDHIAYAEHLFDKYGSHTVFFGRFIALLRILAGPLAGSLKMPYPRFLVANALGGLVWAGGMTALVFALGRVAGKIVSDGAWILLAVLVVGGFIASRKYKGMLDQRVREYAEPRRRGTSPASGRAPRRRTDQAGQSSELVWSWGSPTSLLSGEPRSRR